MIIAFHKPYGVLSQFNENPDQPGQRTLTDFDLPSCCLPIGRLDLDSEGLLLLSDDPAVETKLFHSSQEHRRLYTVQVEGQVDDAGLRLLREGGMDIRGHKVLPCQAKKLVEAPVLDEREPAVVVHPKLGCSWLELELREGKNRQVRRMTAKIGHPTQRLVRLKIGDYSLESLPPGAWIELSEASIQQLFIR